MTKKRGTSGMKGKRRQVKREDCYVVGYDLPGNAIYGQDHFWDKEQPNKGFAFPMRLFQAQRHSKEIASGGYKAIIYELVPLPPKKKARSKHNG